MNFVYRGTDCEIRPVCDFSPGTFFRTEKDGMFCMFLRMERPCVRVINLMNGSECLLDECVSARKINFLGKKPQEILLKLLRPGACFSFGVSDSAGLCLKIVCGPGGEQRYIDLEEGKIETADGDRLVYRVRNDVLWKYEMDAERGRDEN